MMLFILQLTWHRLVSTKKIALITGANKGIGLETARQLAKQGVTVLAGARDEAKVDQAAAALRKEGLDVHRIVIDVNLIRFPPGTLFGAPSECVN
jgi:NAD(P)-dependent dehydrogenase (short-subunit alcohol dehydrogenase family)